ncbi:hypothetical protein BD413DRAFT_574055 [Trametes elegans]|nr:hypothetical protein BD413DRAFT_574055 [Trametes elegans]
MIRSQYRTPRNRIGSSAESVRRTKTFTPLLLDVSRHPNWTNGPILEKPCVRTSGSRHATREAPSLQASLVELTLGIRRVFLLHVHGNFEGSLDFDFEGLCHICISRCSCGSVRQTMHCIDAVLFKCNTCICAFSHQAMCGLIVRALRWRSSWPGNDVDVQWTLTEAKALNHAS